jgi:hypothetical protein
MEQKATIEDIDRTRGRILSAYENGHGIELSPQEVERLVGMMMSMEGSSAPGSSSSRRSRCSPGR